MGRARRFAEGLTRVEVGSKLAEGGWLAPELLRLKGELLLLRSEPADAEASEAHFHQALEAARQQGALSWELRAAMSLARLWCDRGKRNEARDLLGPVYCWFTEGFDTLDLKEAKALLEDLAVEDPGSTAAGKRLLPAAQFRN